MSLVNDNYKRKWDTLKEYLNNTITMGIACNPDNDVHNAKIKTLEAVKSFMEKLE